MESQINWLHLPDIIWELILCNLKVKHLLNASETCKKFNYLLSRSPRLMKKLSLRIGNPDPFKFLILHNPAREKEYEEYLCKFKLFKKCLQKSNRKYDSIIICDIKCAIFDIVKQFAKSVEQIKFLESSLQDGEFFKIIQIMKNLKILKFEGRFFNIGQDKTSKKIVSSVNEIYIDNVEGFSFKKLHLFDKIIILDVYDCDYDCETFESFLLVQKNLKVLHLRSQRDDSLFRTDELTNNIKFSLHELTLDTVQWTDNEIALKFFKTQINLKKVSLELQNLDKIGVDERMCHDDLLIHFFGNNLQLKTVFLTSECNINDFSFLDGIVNSSVENLELRLDPLQNATELIIVFAKLFPNVKNFTYAVSNETDHGLDQINNWKSLESIKCEIRDINQLFENINLNEKLTTCTINCTFRSQLKSPKLMEFLTCHKNIKHMTFCASRFHINISDEILSLIVNTTKSLETLICNGKNYII